MEYGYVRISTHKQNIERQIRNILKEYPNAKIIQEIYTGRKIERAEFQKLLNRVKEGDKIIFDSVSRMSRNAEDGFQLYKKLYNDGIDLIFLKEPYVNTESYRNTLNNTIPLTDTPTDILLKAVNEYMMVLAEEHIKLAFKQSQKEIDDLSQRTKEGLITARLKGKQIGHRKGDTYVTKKSIETKKLIQQHSKYFGGSLSDKELIALIKGQTGSMDRETYYKYKKELKAELNT